MLVERHGEIDAPTLCLWGVHDPWQTISDGERLAREISECAPRAGGDRVALDPARHAGEICGGSEQLSRRWLEPNRMHYQVSPRPMKDQNVQREAFANYLSGVQTKMAFISVE